MEYPILLQELAEHLNKDSFRRIYIKALDDQDSDAQASCLSEIQHYISKSKHIPKEYRAETIYQNVLNDLVIWGPITPYILNGADQGISEVKVYGPNDIRIHQHGQWKSLDDVVFYDEEALTNVVKRMLGTSNMRFNDLNGYTDRVKLPCGARVAIVGWPNTDVSYYISCRLYKNDMFTSDSLVKNGSVSLRQDRLIKFLMRGKTNSSFMGPMSTGKTTVLAAYLPHLSTEWHILTIEDSPEFMLKQRNPLMNVTALYTREGDSGITWETAASFSLRTAADIIFWGELRNAAAASRAINNMTTGHYGSGFTGHAGSALEGLSNLANLYQEAKPSLDFDQALERVCRAINVIYMLRRSRTGKRFMSDISAISWDSKLREPIVKTIITRSLDIEDQPQETFHGIPDFLKDKMINTNAVFEEDFEEWKC